MCPNIQQLVVLWGPNQNLGGILELDKLSDNEFCPRMSDDFKAYFEYWIRDYDCFGFFGAFLIPLLVQLQLHPSMFPF